MDYNTKLLGTSEEELRYAAGLLARGEIVGMPTETVYGLAADAENPRAVERIFAAKGRPQDNPLIVHIADIAQLEEYAHSIPDIAYKLAEKFWPGPLTMVLPKKDKIPDITSAGLNTVGIRMPCHKAARSLIRYSGKALAAPSANLSGSPSPTEAAHVMADMSGRIPAVVDGGSCPVGVESTVISFEGDAVRILRPGFVSSEELSELAEVIHDKHITEAAAEGEKVLSPGMKYKHYSPKANVVIVDGSEEQYLDYVNHQVGDGVCAMLFGSEADRCMIPHIAYGDTSEEQAAKLFAVLRKLDDIGAEQVYARMPSTEGVGLAVYNRLLRAAGFEIIKP
ncbi:MAG: threonylcarbamoyl-AMP synthase [Oscillospiraceae bacterium]|nr:threonylcarbamoyl-AMP synthase [Oscillospiraceae bacterium]